jgi:peptidase M1-like protein
MVYLRALRGVQVIVSPAPSASPFRPRLPAALVASLLTVLAWPSSPLAAAEPDPIALLERLDSAWKARDEAAWLGAWRLHSEEERTEERDYVRERWAGEESRLEIERPSEVLRSPFKVPATVVSIAEPRGRVEQAVFTLERGADGWAVTARKVVSQIDGLVHLSLGPKAFRADGLSLKLPDFELRFRRGTLFLPPPTLGPTVLVFVGDATVRFVPGPATEKEQLRQFAGRPELLETVHAAFIRIHPADFHRILSGAELEPDARAEGARGAALKFFKEHVDDTYQLVGPLPRAPWWLIPGLGDSVVTFQTRRGALTFTVSQSEPEGLSLFDRARRRQVCLYPLPGTEARYDEDQEREIDVVHHDLTVRFEPDRYGLVGSDTLRIRLRTATSTIRLRLAEDLRVVSIRSREGGDHLFFRVRHQDGMVVSLGTLSGTLGEITLTVRFAGNLRPHEVEHELLQAVAPPVGLDDDIGVEEALVYSNRSPWYPQGEADDYATADLHLDVPAGVMAVSGGRQVSLRTESGRTRVEYKQDLPGKYITVAVGRLLEAGRQVEGDLALTAWAAPRLRGVADARIAEALSILRFYESEFGPCPYPSLNLVLVESRVPGGHSPPGMIIVSVRPALLRGALRDDPASFPEVPEFFIAHELAHQWWGHGVAGQNYHERWISEAFAQYAAALWVRESRGASAFRNMLSRMGRWALRYANKGPIHLGHRLGHIENDPQVYRAVVYDKGAYVLHMLRQIVGPEAFRRAVVALQTAHRFGKIGTDDVRAALDLASGLELRPYFAAWVYGTSLPELRLATRSSPGGEGYRTEITVHGRDLPGPVPLEVAVAHPAGTEVRTVSLEPSGGSWTVDTPGPPRRVDVNGGRGLLARVIRN